MGRHCLSVKIVEWMWLLPNPANVRSCNVFCWQELKALHSAVISLQLLVTDVFC